MNIGKIKSKIIEELNERLVEIEERKEKIARLNNINQSIINEIEELKSKEEEIEKKLDDINEVNQKQIINIYHKLYK